MNTIKQPAIGAHYQMDNKIYEVTTVGTVIGLCSLETGARTFLDKREFTELQIRKAITLYQNAPIALSLDARWALTIEEERDALSCRHNCQIDLAGYNRKYSASKYKSKGKQNNNRHPSTSIEINLQEIDLIIVDNNGNVIEKPMLVTVINQNIGMCIGFAILEGV